MINPITEGLPCDPVKNATKTSKRLNLTPGTPFERKFPRKTSKIKNNPPEKSIKKHRWYRCYRKPKTKTTETNKTYVFHGL